MAINNIICKPDVVTFQTEDKWVKPKEANGDYVWEDIELYVKVLKTGIHIKVTADSTPLKRVVLRWKSIMEPGTQILGDAWERGYGDLEWRGIVPERVMPWYFLTNNNNETHGYGVKTGPKAMCFWEVDSDYITLCLDVRCGGKGVHLNGRVLDAATVVLREGSECETPFKAAKLFCASLCDNPVFPTTPIYGGNNWYYAYGASSDNQIIEDSKLIADLSPVSQNRPYMLIDAGWQNYGFKSEALGTWKNGNKLFPNMQALAGKMKEIGTKPGIWTRPLITFETVDKSWLIDPKRSNANFEGLILDPSLPEVLEKISDEMNTLSAWGYEIIKHDFSTFDIFGKWGFEMKSKITEDGWSFSDNSKTSAEIVLNLYKTIRKASGSSMIIGCNTISHLAAGIFEMQRTGDDISGRQWERTRKMGVNTLAFRMSQHNTFYACDADCVGITNKVPWRLNKEWLNLLAQSGTVLLISAAKEALDAEVKKSISKAFEIAAKGQLNCEPLDWFDTTSPSKWLINDKAKTFSWTNLDKIEECE